MSTVLAKTNRRALKELVAQDPLAAQRCFHTTVKLVLEELCNCSPRAPGRRSLPTHQHPDGFPCRTEPGIFGYICGYLGMVEPRACKSLHIHMMLQVLGFAHPSDLSGNGDFACMFSRVWQYVASICVRSVEAFAAHTSELATTTALQTSPLMPVTLKQQGMIGVSRTHEAIGAQLRARGLKTTPPAVSIRREQFVYWTPQRYNDPGIFLQCLCCRNNTRCQCWLSEVWESRVRT